MHSMIRRSQKQEDERQIEILFDKYYTLKNELEELRNDYGNLYEIETERYDDVLNDINGIHKRFNTFKVDNIEKIMKSYNEHALLTNTKMYVYEKDNEKVWAHITFFYYLIFYILCAGPLRPYIDLYMPYVIPYLKSLCTSIIIYMNELISSCIVSEHYN